MDARKKTNELLEAIEEGVVDRDYVIRSCLTFLSEDAVGEMMRANEIVCNECDKISCECEIERIPEPSGPWATQDDYI
tara:strand:+ start:430 stop:663 length:234 start_codon:yes stop_codon:yes gene_type:complete